MSEQITDAKKYLTEEEQQLLQYQVGSSGYAVTLLIAERKKVERLKAAAETMWLVYAELYPPNVESAAAAELRAALEGK